MIELLKKLLPVCGVSGGEAVICEKIAALISPYCDDVRCDALGNLIAHKKSKNANAKKLLLSAHMDEIGLIVNAPDANGQLRVASVGNFSAASFAYGEVRSESGLGGQFLPIGKYKTDSDVADFAVSLGELSSKEAKTRIPTGTHFAFRAPYRRLLGNRFTAHPLDGRLGCALLCHLLQTVQDSPYDLYFVFTVQQAVGGRGACVAAFSIEPDYAVVLDCAPASDALAVGKGVGIKLKDKQALCDVRLTNRLRALAKEQKISHQIEIQSESASDAFAFQRTGIGVRTAALSLPIAQYHTPAETASLQDAQSAFALLCAFVAKAWEE